MDIIEKPRHRKPFQNYFTWPINVSGLSKSLYHVQENCCKQKATFDIQKARVLDYSQDHVSEVWVKYSVSDEEEWRKFSILKRVLVLTPSDQAKYDDYIAVASKKYADINKIVDQYVPEEFNEFYDTVAPAEDASLDTEDSDCWLPVSLSNAHWTHFLPYK